jgi:5-methyltetrahydrofolate--homocysteine methyltransferase
MDFEVLYTAVIEGDAPTVEQEVQATLARGVPADTLLDEALIPAMDEVGRLFEAGEVFVPEMLVAAHAMQAALNLLRPLLAATGKEPVGRVAIGTVAGDLHDIGKNLVGLMLEGAGFSVQDLGVDVRSEKFVEAARNGAQIVAMSALLTTTMPAMKSSVEALVEAGVRNSVVVMVGGAPVTDKFAREIGADAFASDAASAVRAARDLLGLD